MQFTLIPKLIDYSHNHVVIVNIASIPDTIAVAMNMAFVEQQCRKSDLTNSS